jgi:hypothetical protein
MEQKDRPPAPLSSLQRDSSGKGTHDPVPPPVDDEPPHRRCKPMVSVTVPPEGDGTVKETQAGEMMDVMVMAVAVGWLAHCACNCPIINGGG